MSFDALIAEASARTGVPVSVIRATIQAESAFNPYAKSSAGAKGLMQLLDSTGREVFRQGRYSGAYNPYDARTNINVGTDYLKQLYTKYAGNWDKALAAYNMGPEALRQNGGVPYEQTAQYVNKIKSNAGMSSLTDAAINEATGQITDKAGDMAAEALGLDSLFSSGASAVPVGTAANGGLLMSDGSIGVSSLANGGVGTMAPEAVSGWDLSGIGSAGNYYLPAMGVAGAVDLFGNKRHGGRGALQGMASGAGIGSYFGPMGALVGAGVGGVAGYFGNFGDKDRWKEEQSRFAELRKKGINIPQAEADFLSRGRSKDELIALEKLKQSKGMYGNPTFAASRNVKDLTYQDTWGIPDWYEKYGNDYLQNMSETQRKRLNELALSSDAVTEGKGQVRVDFNKISQAAIDEILKGDKNGKIKK